MADSLIDSLEQDAIEVAEDQKPPEKVVDDPKKKRCPPTSSLLLTGEQEDKLMSFISDVVKDLENDNAEFIRHRDHWIAEHENDFKHRVHPGTTFARSNSSFNQSRRNAVPIIARLTRDYLGTDPFFAVKPIRRVGNTIEADDIQSFSEYKLHRARLKEALEDAIEMAAVVGERVEMITFERDVSLSKEKATVLVDGDGEPIRTSRGKPIYDYDLWVDSSYFMKPLPDKDAAGSTPGTQPEAPKGSDIDQLKERLAKWGQKFRPVPIEPQASGTYVLKKDPSIVVDLDQGIGPAAGTVDSVTGQPVPGNGIYKKILVDKYEVHYSGPRVSGVHHGDMLIPLNAEDIQTCPYIVRKFDMTVPEIVERYYMAVNSEDLDPEEKLFYGLLADKLELLDGGDAEGKSELHKPDHHNHEQTTAKSDKYNTRVKLAEIYLRADPDGTGFQKEIMAVVAIEQRFCLFYDYTDNITAPGMGRPFRVVRITPKRGRWYGISEYKLNAHKQAFIDWCLNEVVYKNAVDGTFVLYDEDAAEGWHLAEPQPGEKMHKWKSSGSCKDPEKAVTFIAPPPIPTELLDLMKNMMQSAQAERGNLAPGGDSMQDLPSSKLKYGIQAIQQAGDEVYALSAMNCERGMTDVVQACVITMLANMDPIEYYRQTNGDDYLETQLSRSDIEDIEMDVSLEMTLTRGDQMNQQNELAMNIVLSYKALLPCDQVDVRDFVIARLKSMDIQDVEKHVVTPDPSDVALSMAAKRGQWQIMAQGPQPAPTASGPAPNGAGAPGEQPGPTTPPAKRI